MHAGKILVTGGAGFIGSHVAEFYADKGAEVVVLDNLSREKLLGKGGSNSEFNWNYLKRYKNIGLVKGDVRDAKTVESATKGMDFIVHTAAQVSVPVSVANPAADFENNALGTFNVLEAARKNDVPGVVYCSTNKVYGENVNALAIKESAKRYDFADIEGIDESLATDLCTHTPYGCSKLAGDIYAQDYGSLYGLRTGVFRMGCIYGPRQFGFEEQGWTAWFVIAVLTGKPITIYGDGKQVRDLLYVGDLIWAYDSFINSKIKSDVFNIGGGKVNSASLLEAIDFIEAETGKKAKLSYAAWRPSDQKVYISDIRKLGEKLGWRPKVPLHEGMRKLISWVRENRKLFV